MKVTSVEADGIWMSQDIDLGAFGKQEVKTLIDSETGAVKKMIVNGKGYHLLADEHRGKELVVRVEFEDYRFLNAPLFYHM